MNLLIGVKMHLRLELGEDLLEFASLLVPRCGLFILQSNLINTTLVYTTPSTITTHFCDIEFLGSKFPLLYDYDIR